mmetsp:Transcript_1691/g.3259  ORF Transcript_1691/g.3259 Transcript_1691/m.3259 type:complete len:120 (+) Transcript_1691:107-466(+)
MMLGPLEASLLGILVGVSGASRVLEIGTFTGYSAMAMIEALPQEGGYIKSIDKDPRCHALAREHLSRHPKGDKVDLVLGDAMEILDKLPEDDPYDVVFIDADKKMYLRYYEAILAKKID